MGKHSTHRQGDKNSTIADRGIVIAGAGGLGTVTAPTATSDVMQLLGVGHVLFAVAVAGLGVLGLATGHFASVWQPVPPHLPAREILAYLNGVLMVLLGLGLLVNRTTRVAAIVVTAYFLFWFFVLHGPKVVSAPLRANTWGAFGENGTLIVGGLILIALNAVKHNGPLPNVLKGSSGVHFAVVVFACAAFLMSLTNFAYPKANADFPPDWIPHWYGWGFLVGGAYVATGLSILLRVCPRFATIAAAVMMSLITVLCWLSFVVTAPTSRLNWTGLLISMALTGAGWMVAESYRNRAWFELPWRAVKPQPQNQIGDSRGLS